MNNGVRLKISDSGAIRSTVVPKVNIRRPCVAFWHKARLVCGGIHITLERGIRQPTTMASTMPPVLSLRQWPSIQRQANGS